MSEEIERNDREDLFSKAVKAGKRTYFFDVKATKGNDYYLTITESKKRIEFSNSLISEKFYTNIFIIHIRILVRKERPITF